MYYKYVLKWYRTLLKFKPKLYLWDSIPNVLRTRYELDSKIIYLSTASASSAGPLELSLAAFFFIAFKLDFFKPFLVTFLGGGLAGVLASDLLSRK